jgi:type I restriction enzyme, S subunit
MTRLTAAQQRFLENATLIAATRVIFDRLEESGVPLVRLDVIADTTSGGTPTRGNSRYYDGDIPWIKSGELEDDVIDHAEEFITEDGLHNSSAKVFPKGTLLVALYGATVGKTGVLTIDAATNQAVCAVMPKSNDVTITYLHWFLRHKRSDFLGNSFGGAQPNISQKVLRETVLPLPSVDVQQSITDFLQAVEARKRGKAVSVPTLPSRLADVPRLVARIEALAAKIEEARGLRRLAVEEAEALMGAALVNVFKGQPNTDVIALGNVANYQRGRFSHRPRNDSRFYDGPYPFIQINDIPKNKKLITEYSQSLNDEGLGISKMFPTGTLVISIAATIGAVSILGFDSCMPDSLVGIAADKEKTTNDYLYYFMCYEQSHLSEIAPSSAQKNINIRILNDVKLPVPSLEEQRRIVVYLDGLQARVDALKQLQAQTQVELDALLPSVLDRAFKGEL